MDQNHSRLELYKCAVLTVIAVTLIGIYLKTPTPFTLQNVRDKKVEMVEIPLVRIQGGRVDADINN